MEENKISTTSTELENRILTIRGKQVMLDSDLAVLYNVETKQLNRATKRNIDRFPERFMFQLTEVELGNLRCQIGTSSINNVHGGRRYLPYIFTEHGVTMLASVLTSKLAITISMQIIDTFIAMRKIISENNFIDQRLNKLERTQINSEMKFEEIFKALEKKESQPEKGIFFEGEIFDAYIFISNLIRKAEKSIILIDNYIDDSVLTLFSKRKKGVHIQLYTKDIPKQLQLDIVKFNQQYPTLEAKILKNSHDRFLIIDETKLYHIGASLKDVGKKWFAFSKMDSESLKILSKLP
jgi:hypothetical protein